MHSSWTLLSWPPVDLTLMGAAISRFDAFDAAELAYGFIDSAISQR